VVRAIAGLERSARGRIAFNGDPWLDTAAGVFVPPQRRRVGCVFQDAALFPHLSVLDNVRYAAPPAGAALPAADLLDLLDIRDLAARRPGQLSGGQAQRVALARALAAGPRLLLLDEPFAALDVPARGALRRLLRAVLQRLGVAAVLVTHDRTEAIALGDQMAVLAGGRIRQVGPVLDVFRRPADLAVAESVGVESVLPARVERVVEGLAELRVGPALLRAVDLSGDLEARDVFACIRAEDVTLERGAGQAASARNHLPGRIVSIDSEGPIERLALDCGFPLAALITRHAREEMALRPGAPIVAAVKATAIHLVPKV
jgi:molybdate transport system ATP-binding protein